MVKQCIHELNRLGKQKSVVIKWIKAHAGHEFNEVADLEAKSGTRSSVEEERQSLSRSSDRQWK